MNTTQADPMFVRAEMDYRLEQWGTTARRHAEWPDAGGRLARRLLGALRPSSRTTTRGTVAVHRPRHP